MNAKQKLIDKMINMQKKFIEKQRKTGITPREYFAPTEDEALNGYHAEFEEMAAQVVDIAHGEQGTSR